MLCATCGVRHEAGARFCHRCGAAVPAAPDPGLSRARWKTAGLWLAALFLAFQSVAYFASVGDSLQARIMPRYQFRPNPMNGLFLCAGAFFAGLALLALDAATRKAGRPGVADRFFASAARTRLLSVAGVLAAGAALLIREERGIAAYVFVGTAGGGVLLAARKAWIRPEAVAPVLAALLSLGGAAWVGLAETAWYPDGEAAARGVREHGLSSRLSNAGDVLFARDDAGRTHRAAITPDLVRALRREGIPAGVFVQSEFVAPGSAPLWVLGAALLLEWLVSRGGASYRMRLAALFGVVSLFVVPWTAAAQRGLLTAGNFVHPEWAAQFFVVGLTGAAFFRWAYARMAPAPLLQRAGWACPYFLWTLSAPLAVFLVTERSPGNPLLLWVLVFAGLGALCWARAVRPREGEPA